MMSVQSYFEHYLKQKKYIDDEGSYTNYWYNSDTFEDLKRSMELAMLNLCKALLTFHNIPFKDETDEAIIKFVEAIPKYNTTINMWRQCVTHWEWAVRGRNKRYYRYRVALVMGELEKLERIVIAECGIC